MLRCKNLVRLIASGELEMAGWPARLAVRVHLLMCRHCRRYEAQLRGIGRAARQLWGTSDQTEQRRALDRVERAVLDGVADHGPAPPDPAEGDGQ